MKSDITKLISAKTHLVVVAAAVRVVLVFI